MAQAEHLPIYKASYDLCLSLEQVVRSFSRYHKYTLGTDLRDGARRVLKLVVRANTRRDKAPVLLELRGSRGAEGHPAPVPGCEGVCQLRRLRAGNVLVLRGADGTKRAWAAYRRARAEAGLPAVTTDHFGYAALVYVGDTHEVGVRIGS